MTRIPWPRVLCVCSAIACAHVAAMAQEDESESVKIPAETHAAIEKLTQAGVDAKAEVRNGEVVCIVHWPEVADESFLKVVRGLPNVWVSFLDADDERLRQAATIKGLRFLICAMQGVTADGLTAIARHERIDEIVLMEVTDEQLLGLKGCRPLSRLIVNTERLSHRGLAGLKGLHCKYLRFFGNLRDEDLPALADLGSVETLRLYVNGSSPYKLTTKSLHHLCRLKGLKSLAISNLDGRGIGLGALATAPDLESLELNFELSRRGFQELAAFRSIKELHLIDLMITDKDLAHLGAMQRLDLLNVEGCTNVTGEGLAKLANVPIKKLLISAYSYSEDQPKISDHTIQGLGQIKSLEHLEMLFGDVVYSKSALAEITKLPNLRTLRIKGDYTDADLLQLQKCRKLLELHLDAPEVSALGAARLKMLMPGLVIDGVEELELTPPSPRAMLDRPAYGKSRLAETVLPTLR